MTQDQKLEVGSRLPPPLTQGILDFSRFDSGSKVGSWVQTPPPTPHLHRKFWIWADLTQDQKLEVGSRPLTQGILDFSRFDSGSKVGNWVQTPPQPPIYIGNFGFEQIWLRIKSWKLGPDHSHREFWILVDLTQDQKLEIGSRLSPPPPPSPQLHREFWILADLDSGSKVGSHLLPPPKKR